MVTRRKLRSDKLSDIEEANGEIAMNNTKIEDKNAYDDLELDDLFDQLKQNIKSQEQDPESSDEFSKVRKSVAKLSKLKDTNETLSGLVKDTTDKEYLRSAKTEQYHKSNITHINDPIQVRKKKDAEKTDSGSKWFNMPKGELTESNKRDIRLIQNRAALDPKRHYKKEKWKTPEFFQVGTIVESSAEFFSSRLKKKERHETMLDSLLKDQDTKGYFKRKYDEIQVKKTSGKMRDYRKAREARKRF